MQNIICFALQPNLYCKFCHPKKAWLYWWLAVKWNARVFPFFEFLNKLDPETDVTKALNSFSLIWLSVLNCLCAEVVHSQVLTQMEQLGKRNFHWVFWLLDSSNQGIESEKVIGFGRLAWKPVFWALFDFHVNSLLAHFKGTLTDPWICGHRKHSLTHVFCESSVCFDDVKVDK